MNKKTQCRAGALGMILIVVGVLLAGCASDGSRTMTTSAPTSRDYKPQ